MNENLLGGAKVQDFGRLVEQLVLLGHGQGAMMVAQGLGQKIAAQLNYADLDTLFDFVDETAEAMGIE